MNGWVGAQTFDILKKENCWLRPCCCILQVENNSFCLTDKPFSYKFRTVSKNAFNNADAITEDFLLYFATNVNMYIYIYIILAGIFYIMTVSVKSQNKPFFKMFVFLHFVNIYFVYLCFIIVLLLHGSGLWSSFDLETAENRFLVLFFSIMSQ